MGRFSIVRSLANFALVVLAATSAASYRHRHHQYRRSGSGEILGYYADWTNGQLDPKNIPYSKLTHIGYAFLEVNEDASLTGITNSTLQSVVKYAHAKGVKVQIAIGGWDGGRWYSHIVQNDALRKTLIDNIVSFSKAFDLDGAIIDWEYPNDPNGMSCNTISSSDSANLLTFLTELRAKVGKSFILSAATALTPFNGPDGNPLTDVSDFSKVLDRVQLMAYDIMGAWDSTTGANSPLYSIKGAPDPTSGNSGVEAWTKAKFPASQIMLGVPFYGIIETVTVNMNKKGTSQFQKFQLPQRQGDKYDTLSADPCPGAKSSYSGEYQFGSLLANGILSSPTTAGSGWTRHFDSGTETPWLYSSSKQAFITYDDPTSMGIKANYAKDHKLAGIMIWSLEMDPQHDLLDALQIVR